MSAPRKRGAKPAADGDLRAAAEERMGRSPRAPSPTDEPRERLIHDLQVHQIELEMQNAALREARNALEESRDKYLDLFDFAPTAYFTLTGASVIAEANLAGATLLGVPRARLAGKEFRSFVASADLQRWDAHLADQLRRTERGDCELTLERADGSAVRARLSSIRLASGGATDIRIAASDISDLWRAEQDRAALGLRLARARKIESQQALAGGLAHKLNSLLTTKLIELEMAVADLPAASRPLQSVEAATRAAKAMAELAAALLKASGHGFSDRHEVDLSAVLGEHAHALAVGLPRSVKLERRLDANLSRVLVDPHEIELIAANLITNAWEAIGETGGTVVLATGEQECDASYLRQDLSGGEVAAGRFVWLEVSDDGGGMSDETKRRLFEPLFSTKLPGRGLGLAAVLGIVRSYQGAIVVDSRPGAGTVVRVLVPAVRRQASDLRVRPSEV